MSAQPTPRRPPVVAYIFYDDAPAAIEFLCKAFGFEETYRYPMPDGRIGHAELAYRGARAIYLASAHEEMGFQSPKDLPGVHCQMACQVDDLDAHHERARDAGATIAAEPQDQDHGDRMYRAVDPEGHRWMFSMPIKTSA